MVSTSHFDEQKGNKESRNIIGLSNDTCKAAECCGPGYYYGTDNSNAKKCIPSSP